MIDTYQHIKRQSGQTKLSDSYSIAALDSIGILGMPSNRAFRVVTSLSSLTLSLSALPGSSFADTAETDGRQDVLVPSQANILPSQVYVINRMGLPFGNFFIRRVEIEYFYKDAGTHKGSAKITDSRPSIDPGRSKIYTISAARCMYNFTIKLEGVDANGKKVVLTGGDPIVRLAPTSDEPGPLGAGCFIQRYFYTDAMIKVAP